MIERDANLITFHYDRDGPWDAAPANDFSQFPQDFQEEIDSYNILRPNNYSFCALKRLDPSHQVFTAYTSMSYYLPVGNVFSRGGSET